MKKRALWSIIGTLGLLLVIGAILEENVRWGAVLIITVVLPILSTLFNLVRLVMNLTGRDIKWRIVGWVENYCVVGGAILSGILYAFMEYRDYTEALHPLLETSDYHAPLAQNNIPTVIVLILIAIVGYLLFKVKKGLPPLALALAISGVYLGLSLSILWIIQLSKNVGSVVTTDSIAIFLFLLYPINYIILSFIAFEKAMLNSTEYKGNNRALAALSKLIGTAKASWLWAFVLLLPICGIALAVLAIFGQRPDAIVTAFTHTSDWTFSKMVSPPPIYDGHYLCTVAAKGHRGLVKPLRYGTRHGHKIIVNRQLQVANAFEELIAERRPRLHRRIRKFYDTYGYPISKHIKRKAAADAVYLLMKPLEWLFLAVLYFFDKKPENRIARQYL